MCIVKSFKPERYIALLSKCHVEGEAFALHPTVTPQNLFQTITLLEDWLRQVQSDSQAVRSVWHGHSYSKHLGPTLADH